MEALVYFIVWAVFIFLMMRFGCGSHILGKGHSHDPSPNETEKSSTQQLSWVPPDTDIDPVCKESVATDTAKSSVHDGSVYYFCSRDCREVFEAAPDLYVGSGDVTQKELEFSNA